MVLAGSTHQEAADAVGSSRGAVGHWMKQAGYSCHRSRAPKRASPPVEKERPPLVVLWGQSPPRFYGEVARPVELEQVMAQWRARVETYSVADVQERWDRAIGL